MRRLCPYRIAFGSCVRTLHITQTRVRLHAHPGAPLRPGVARAAVAAMGVAHRDKECRCSNPYPYERFSDSDLYIIYICMCKHIYMHFSFRETTICVINAVHFPATVFIFLFLYPHVCIYVYIYMDICEESACEGFLFSELTPVRRQGLPHASSVRGGLVTKDRV